MLGYGRKVKSFILSLFLAALCLTSASLSARSQCRYNKDGLLIERINGNGQVVEYSYDKAGQLTQIKADPPQVSLGKHRITYQYDLNGQLINMTDSTGTTSYEYDLYGQLQSASAPHRGKIVYTYDLARRLIGIEHSAGYKVSYHYDGDGRLTEVTDQDGTTRYLYSNRSGLLIRVILPNGCSTAYTYDASRRLTKISHSRQNADQVASFAYLYDERGNRIEAEVSDLGQERRIRHAYDELNRLVEWSDNRGQFERYTYDPIGNRLSKETPDGMIHYEYDRANRLIRAGDAHFAYDGEGNLIRKERPSQSVNYQYDASRRLIAVCDGEHQVNFDYDGCGRRVSKTVDGKKIYYVTDARTPHTKLLGELNEAGHLVKAYTHGHQPIKGCFAEGGGYCLYDGVQGNVIAYMKPDGETIAPYLYSPFGESIEVPFDEEPPFGFCGEEKDRETGLIYLRNRYYDPEIGRFITADPSLGRFDDPQSLNPYAYCRNNPVNHFDPLGLDDQIESNSDWWFLVFSNPTDLYAFSPEAIGKSGSEKLAMGWPVSDLIATGGRECEIQQIGHYEPYVGHAFIALVPPSGKPECIGNARATRGPRRDWKNIFKYTKMGAWRVPEEAATTILSKFDRLGYDFFKDNCVRRVTEAMDIAGIAHPSLKSLGIDNPRRLANWLPHRVAEINLQDYGGVCLSATADLKFPFDSLAGAVFDPTLGQLVLFAEQDIGLPQMDVDDLTVAIRSLYGLGGRVAEDPGVSIEINPRDPNGSQIVVFSGQTQNTRFGQAMLEADLLLKNLTMGIDHQTGVPINCPVPGYRSMVDWLSESYNQVAASGGFYWEEPTSPLYRSSRFWLEPAHVELALSDDGQSMFFSRAEMQLCYHPQADVVWAGAGLLFADHFMKNWNLYADTYPILREVERLGKLTAIVKWLRDYRIPIDLSFFEQRKVAWHDTAKKVDRVENAIKFYFNTTDIEAALADRTMPPLLITAPLSAHVFLEGLACQLHWLTGGVIYRFNNSNFSTFSSPYPLHLSETALVSRPDACHFGWNFAGFNPSGSYSQYQAIAQPWIRTPKDGNHLTQETDLSFPAKGKVFFGLQRTYNSFRFLPTGFGIGWDEVPLRLAFFGEKNAVGSSVDEKIARGFPGIYVTENGREALYQLMGIDREGRPYYRCFGLRANELVEELDGTYTLTKRQSGLEIAHFSKKGMVQRIEGSDGAGVNYIYTGSRLIHIQHDDGRKITLLYRSNRIVEACGPSGPAVTYTYTAEGQLETVRRRERLLSQYAYDADLRLTGEADGTGCLLFKGSYDPYNRLVKSGGAMGEGSASYDLECNTTIFTGPSGTHERLCRDCSGRIIHYRDPYGNSQSYEYEENSYAPSHIYDDQGNGTSCRYDRCGRLTWTKNQRGAESTWSYDHNGNLLQASSGRRHETLYRYDEKGRMIACLIGDQSTSISYEGDTATVVDPTGEVWTVTYDDYGEVKEIGFPSGYRLYYEKDAEGNLERISDGFGMLLQADACELEENAQGVTIPTQEAHLTYDKQGRLVSIRDAMGKETQYCYDDDHHILRIILPNGSELHRRVEEETLVEEWAA